MAILEIIQAISERGNDDVIAYVRPKQIWFVKVALNIVCHHSRTFQPISVTVDREMLFSALKKSIKLIFHI